jgi:integrase/recombinase XerD
VVKASRNPIQFFYKYMLGQQWQWVNIIKPPRVQPLQDVLSMVEMAAIISATQKLSQQTYYLTVADIDRHLMRVRIRHTKGNKDRFVHLPLATLEAMRRY